MNARILLVLTSAALFYMQSIYAIVPKNEKFQFQQIAKDFELENGDYLSLYNDLSFELHPPHEFAIITVPKSGTHLFNRLLSMITGKNSTPRLLVAAKKNEFRLMHFWYGHEEGIIKQLLTRRQLRFIIPCRDPRDIAVSAVHFYKDYPNAHKTDLTKLWAQASFDEKLLLVIGHSDSYLKHSLEQFLSFIEKPNVYVSRFEDLIGPAGGGSLEKQKEEILNIAEFINIHLNSQQLDFLCATLFGKSRTFREGKKGSWQTFFKPEHKALFKEMMGEYLIRLGYETNDQW